MEGAMLGDFSAHAMGGFCSIAGQSSTSLSADTLSAFEDEGRITAREKIRSMAKPISKLFLLLSNIKYNGSYSYITAEDQGPTIAL